MMISFDVEETTMTTDKNNSCHLGAAAPAFKSATREYACREAIRLGERKARTAKQPQGPVRGARKSCPVVSKRTYRQVISDGDTPRKGFCYAS